MGIKGKYFMIVAENTGYALDVKDGSTKPGAEVTVWEKNGADSQLWYEDPLSKTICNKKSNLCLDIDDSKYMTLKEQKADSTSQHWRYSKERHAVQNAVDHDLVLDVAHASKHKGARVCAYKFHDAENQKWKIEPALASTFFYIQSEMNGKVLDIDGANKDPGAKVAMYDKKSVEHADNQLWFEDRYGNIRSKLNPLLVLDGSGDCLRTAYFEFGDQKKFWCRWGNKIADVYHPDHVLDIKGKNWFDGAELCRYKDNNQDNQHWKFEYVSVSV